MKGPRVRAEAPGAQSPVGIIAGAGAFPRVLAETLTQRGQPVHVLLLQGLADPELTAFPHAHVRLAGLGGIIAAARRAGCRDLTLIGSLVRPALGLGLLPDLTTLKALPTIVRAYKGGDDHLLSHIARLFEAEGFRLVGVHEWMPELLAPEGQWGSVALNAQDLADLTKARQALTALAPFDIGQGLVISRNHIVAIEGAEGTDGLLERVAAMRANGRIGWRGQSGLFVKAPKAGQERRLDLPAIGPQTVERAVQAGLKGLAVAAGATLVMDLDTVLAKAEAGGLALYGFEESA